jgi:hypothetical protein
MGRHRPTVRPRAGSCVRRAELEFSVMQPRDVQASRAHYVSFVVASLAGLHLLLFLGTGYLFVTTDWRLLACFDGEPGCSERAPDAGLSALHAHHWLLISVAILATLGAFVLALRVRRVAHVVPVLLLCATGAIIAQGFWWL